MMLFRDIILKKAKSGELSEAEINAFVTGLATQSVPIEQLAVMCMAIMLQGMTNRETGYLTMALANSGEIIDWGPMKLDGPVADKHSTGGVGDKVSLALAPIVASCGGYVPMISGRGLGHTGGTLDKLDSIPGYNTTPDSDEFTKIVAEVGCAIVGQSAQLAPAEGRLYAIRDTTATIESIPLISASILAKKYAAGNSALVMDIKTGNGAFMQSLEDARALSRAMIDGGNDIGLQTAVVLTDMSQILGSSAGNALEVQEAIRYLKNETRDSRFDEIVKANCVQLLTMTGLQPDSAAAHERVEHAISSGSAAEVFGRMVSASGGPNDLIDDPDKYLPSASLIAPVFPESSGYVASVDVRMIGNPIVTMGGGRQSLGDDLDYTVGLSDVASVGDLAGPESPLAILHANNQDDFDRAAASIRLAYEVSDRKGRARDLIREIIL